MPNADLNLPVDVHPPPSSPSAYRSRPCGDLVGSARLPLLRLPVVARAAAADVVGGAGPLCHGIYVLFEFVTFKPATHDFGDVLFNVRQASRALEQGKALILKGASETKKEHGKELLEKLAVGMQEIEGIIQQRDREAVAPKQKELLQYVGGIEEDMVDGFPFEIPKEYSNLPLLKGKATVDIKVKVKDNPNVQDCVFRIVLDRIPFSETSATVVGRSGASAQFESKSRKYLCRASGHRRPTRSNVMTSSLVTSSCHHRRGYNVSAIWFLARCPGRPDDPSAAVKPLFTQLRGGAISAPLLAGDLGAGLRWRRADHVEVTSPRCLRV
ncbi:hypothetical protein ZIOFF_000736 [Zingiber officinale]|uniref:peptidylprolyl isomerase n=1 Tax=Zingiber officinale TaxID=94328 RepID=A0A8J5LUL3_ZINOF|nr:hypothetical protein ZIOFF_000736 [Zingiber officinale]